MSVQSVMALALATLLLPHRVLLARCLPVRVAHAAPACATGGSVMPTGATNRGGKLPGRLVPRPGAVLPVNPADGAGCRCGLLLVLRNPR
jgi:hypothetical protein